MDLNFIKVHAPDHILQHFGFYYNIRKYFKTSHLEFMSNHVADEINLIRMMRRWYPTQVFSTFERSQIVYKVLLSVTFGTPENYIGINQLIDQNIFLDIYPLHDGPPHLVNGQTPLEINGRQALYYTWCGYKNLFRLGPLHIIREYLGERIGFFFAFYQFYNAFLFMIAVFGVYVFSKNYDATGRNIQLNEHGMKNTFEMPLNYFPTVITETYKPEEFTDSQGSSVTPGRPLTTRSDFITTYYYYPDLPVCPKCRDLVGCPIRMMEQYENELKCKVFLDNPYAYYMLLLAVVWAILFYFMWVRQENRYYWLWETNEEDAKSLTRPEYRFLPKMKKPSRKPIYGKKEGETFLATKITEEKKIYAKKPIFRSLIEFFVLFFGIFFAFLVYPILMIEMNNKLLNRLRLVEEAGRKLFPNTTRNEEYPEYLHLLDPTVGFKNIEKFNHFVVDLVGSLNGVFIMGMEMAWVYVAKKLIKAHKARTEWTYERTHVSNLIGMTTLINLSVVSFYAFIKGAFYTYPDDDTYWQYPFQLGLHNCGLLHCVDEVYLVYVATFKTKMFFDQVVASLTPLPTDKQRNPEEFSPPLLDRTPCWEREFQLLPVTEDFIMNHYNRLFTQIVVLLCFVTVFPLAPIIVFLWNLWNFKYMANVLVLHSRRPLLVQTWGLGAWKEILFIIPYIACFTNALYLVRNNSLLDRRVNARYWSHQNKRRFLADYYLGFFNMSDFNWSYLARSEIILYTQHYPHITQAKFCMFPGQYNRMISGKKIFVNSYSPMAGKWYINWRQAIVILSSLVLSVGIGFLVSIIISPEAESIRDTRRMEEAIKHYGIEEGTRTKKRK